jgi:hypothetical protein
MATTYTDVVDNTQAREFIGNQLVGFRVSVDLDAVNNGALSNTGIIRLLRIPAYAQIEAFTCEIGEAPVAMTGDTCDFGIEGDDITDDPNGLDDAVDLGAAVGTKTYAAKGTDAGLGVNFGASGGYINMTLKQAYVLATNDGTVIVSGYYSVLDTQTVS